MPALLAAARRYFDATGRRVTFEYVLLQGHNAGRREADELAARNGSSGSSSGDRRRNRGEDLASSSWSRSSIS